MAGADHATGVPRTGGSTSNGLAMLPVCAVVRDGAAVSGAFCVAEQVRSGEHGLAGACA